MEKLRTWNGETAPRFHFIAPTFAEAYRSAVKRSHAKRFLVHYGSTGERTERTFGEFDLDVERARARIRPRGALAGTLALVDRNTYGFLVFATAAWLEGFTLCPLNPDEGVARINDKLGRLGEPVTVWAGVGLPREFRAAIGAEELELGDERAAGPARAAFGPERPMVLIFTSGSTGVSKVVEQLESGILSNVDALIGRHALHEPACIGTPLPLYHVNALEFSFLSALLSGSALVLFERFQIHEILQAARAERVQILSLIPPMVNVLCERKSEVLGARLDSLRYVVTAAAPLSPATAREFADAFPFRLLQGFGLSEAVNFSALMPRDLPADEHRHWATGFARPSIGTALEGNEILILDPHGRELGEGESGEVCVRGFNVMRGYRHDERRECFRGDCLHTGDLGHFVRSASGEKFFFLTGRLKETVKRYGETVSLVEIDDILAAWRSGGRDAIAVAFEHDLAGEEIAVVVNGPSAAEADLPGLKARLDTLPKVIRPALLLWTGDAVRTPSGKPTRWKFQEALAPFRSKIFGGAVALVGDPSGNLAGQ